MPGKNLPMFECSVCGMWTQGGDFLTAGRVNQLGQREWCNFVCFGCQHDHRVLPARASLPNDKQGVRASRDLGRAMYAWMGGS